MTIREQIDFKNKLYYWLQTGKSWIKGRLEYDKNRDQQASKESKARSESK
jgi:hypothetical protein